MNSVSFRYVYTDNRDQIVEKCIVDVFLLLLIVSI